MYRNTWLEVNLDAIQYNVSLIKKISNKKFIAVLKADAYGCGDIMVADAVLEAGADMIAVSSTDEAVILRNKGYSGELMIVGATDVEDVSVLKEQDIQVPAYSLDYVKKLCGLDCTGLKVHLKVDTGMSRIGFRSVDELHEALDLLLKNGCLVKGIFTHFACSDCNPEMTLEQYHRFETAVKALDFPFEWIHCNNSDAAVSFDAPISNACRVGISMYGTSTFRKDLKYALSLYSRITLSKHLESGTTIGYGATYQTEGEEIIATMPIGYADGFFRRNQGRNVYVNGELVPVVGRVCMDQSMIRLNHDVNIGTKVEIFGDHISIDAMAEELGTIPHEIMCLISSRVTRVYIKNGKVISEKNERISESEN